MALHQDHADWAVQVSFIPYKDCHGVYPSAKTGDSGQAVQLLKPLNALTSRAASTSRHIRKQEVVLSFYDYQGRLLSAREIPPSVVIEAQNHLLLSDVAACKGCPAGQCIEVLWELLCLSMVPVFGRRVDTVAGGFQVALSSVTVHACLSLLSAPQHLCCCAATSSCSLYITAA